MPITDLFIHLVCMQKSGKIGPLPVRTCTFYTPPPAYVCLMHPPKSYRMVYI